MNESSSLYRIWELYYIEQTSSYPEIMQKKIRLHDLDIQFQVSRKVIHTSQVL